MPQSPKPASLDHPRQAPVPENSGGRAAVVDVLRGLVMVLMPLDHTREFFTSYSGNPLDPQHTTLLLYLTRWITHLCAPVFVFLAGTSIFLQQQRKIRSQPYPASARAGLMAHHRRTHVGTPGLQFPLAMG